MSQQWEREHGRQYASAPGKEGERREGEHREGEREGEHREGERREGEHREGKEWERGREGERREGEHREGKEWERGREGERAGERREIQIHMEAIRPQYLDEKILKESVSELWKIFWDVKLLQHKLWAFHWNVQGKRAWMLSHLFSELTRLIAPDVDRLAKHIRGLGGRVPWIWECIRHTRLPEIRDGDWPREHEMVDLILRDSENVLRWVCESRRKIEKNDPVTGDFLSDVEKRMIGFNYMIRSHRHERREDRERRGREGERAGERAGERGREGERGHEWRRDEKQLGKEEERGLEGKKEGLAIGHEHERGKVGFAK